MKTFRPTQRVVTLCAAALAAASLAACNQSNQSAPPPPAEATATAPTPVASLPPAPTPPAVPQSNRTPEQESRWQQYLVAKQAYETELARARSQGAHEQAAADAGSQASAFAAGRQVQGHIDQARVAQARQQLAEAEQQAKSVSDPHRRQQMVAQAQANLTAAEQGR